MILGVAMDITEARRAKAQAQAAEGRLRDGIEDPPGSGELIEVERRIASSPRTKCLEAGIGGEGERGQQQRPTSDR
jgi:hypothetical protein